MLQELKFQLSTAVLTVLTVAAAISAGINFSQQLLFRLPDDGVTWIDHAKPGAGTVVQARRVIPNSGADNAGLRDGDILLKINGLTIEKALFVPQALVRIGVWNKAKYLVRRASAQEPMPAGVLTPFSQRSRSAYAAHRHRCRRLSEPTLHGER